MEKQSTRKFLKLIVALVALFLLGASALMLASCNKDEHQHSYTGSVTTPATCSNPGVETFTCSCGAAYTQIIPATNDHAWEKIKVYANSCESEGWTVYECSVCHEQKQDDWTPKLDHKYEAVETVEATCTEDGYQIMQCSYCKSRYTDAQYSSEHKATGHKWIANTDAEDPASDEDKKLGFVTVKEADCLNAAQLERTCSVCDFSEPKESGKPLGHTPKVGVNGAADATYLACAVDETLVDAEGNAVYAIECDRENCPVEVKIDKAGNTAHYIKAEAHQYEVKEENTYCLDVDDPATDVPSYAKGEGMKVEVCKVCGHEEETELAPAGHKWNTVKLDGKNDVVVCEADTGLYNAEDNNKNGLKNYLEVMEEALGADFNADGVATTLISYYGTMVSKVENEKADGFSRYCSDCGALQIADGHDYVISPLEEGKYNKEDYQKNEDGSPVVAEGVTMANIDCRYVQVCQNEGCGHVLARGQHDPEKVSAATCRSDGICEVCGQHVYQQLSHHYISVDAVLDETKKDSDTIEKDVNAYANGLKLTYGTLRNAIKALSADNAWMIPADGGCEDEKTNVWVCVDCLLAAVDEKVEEDVVWNQATELKENETAPADGVSNTNAYVINTGFGHDFQPVYFNLDGTQTYRDRVSCETGFLVKYICSDCGKVYTNVPVANDPTTVDEDTEKETEETNEAAANDAGKYGFTDADGFILDTPAAPAGYTGEDPFYTTEDFDAKALAAALAAKDDHKGAHVVTVVEDYQDYNGTYAAPTCISFAQITVVCANCGESLAYGYDKLIAAPAYAEDTDLDAAKAPAFYYDKGDKTNVETAVNAVVEAKDQDLDATNHAGKAYDCDAHCDVKVEGKFACTGYTADQLKYQNKEGTEAGTTALATMSHATVTVSYDMMTETEDLYGDYSIRIATFNSVSDADNNTTVLDWDKASFAETTKLAVCLDAGNTYTKPVTAAAGTGANEGKYLHNNIKENETTVSYLVLVSADGKSIYPVTGAYNLYTESDGKSEVTDSGNNTVNRPDTFFVKVPSNAIAAPIHATTEATLETAIENAQPDANGALTVQFAADKAITLEDTSVWTKVITKINGNDKIKSLVIDFNGGSVSTDTAIPFDALNNCKAITFKNGTFTFTNPTGYAITVNSKSGLTLTFDNVDIVTDSEAISVTYTATVANQGKLVLKDSTVTSYGKVGIEIDDPQADALGEDVSAVTAVSLEDSSVNMIKDPDPAVTTVNLSTAMLVGARVNVSVKNGSLAANGQAVVVRGGNVTLNGTTVTLYEYDDQREVTSESYEDVIGTVDTISGDDTESVIPEGWTAALSGLTDAEMYRNNGAWSTGAGVSRGAIVVGNSDSGNYAFAASVRLLNVSLDVKDADDKSIVVAARYGAAMEKANTTEATATTPVQYTPIVTINATNSGFASDLVFFTYNTNTAAKNFVSLVGFTK